CDEYPSFVPDGSALAYDTNAGRAHYGLSIVELQTGASHGLTGDGWDYAAAVSPDGASIAFLRLLGSRAAVYLLPTCAPDAARALTRGARATDRLDPVRRGWPPDRRAVWAGGGVEPTLSDATAGEALRTLVAPAGTMLTSLVDLGDGQVAAVAWKLDGTT